VCDYSVWRTYSASLWVGVSLRAFPPAESDLSLDAGGQRADQGQDHGDGQCDRRGDGGGDDVLAQGDRDQGGPSDLTDAVPGRQPRRGVRDAHLRADSDRHHGHSDERGAEQGGRDEQYDRGGTEDGQQGTEDLEAVADGQGADGADASGDEGPQQGRGRGGQTSDEPGRSGRGIAEDGTGQH